MQNRLLCEIKECEIRSVVGSGLDDYHKRPFDINIFIDDTALANTIGDIERLCKELSNNYGFDFFAIFIRLHRLESTPLCFFMREIEDEWTRHYDCNQYMLTDPNIRLAASSITPFFWSSHLFENVKFFLKPYEFDVSYDALEFGLKDIFNAPFQNANGDYGLIRFINRAGGRSADADAKSQVRHISELHYLSSHLYESLVRILSNKQQQNCLSEREQDILFWAAKGLNPAHIGDQLSIADNTVCKHLSNIRSKLGVRNTTHAVARAISEKMIIYR